MSLPPPRRVRLAFGGGELAVFPGADYERVAPARCECCGGAEFDRRGRVGLWDGGRGSGCIYEAVCLGCGSVWKSWSAPFVCRDAPQSLQRHSHKHAEPGAAPARGGE